MGTILSDTVNRWRALSLKRLGHLSDLQQSGRWRRHYATQEAFDEALRTADADAKRWKQLARPDSPTIAPE